MASQGFRERILEVTEDGTALASSTTATSLLNAARKIATLPAGYFDALGKRLCFEFAGRVSTVVTTPGTLTLALRLGSVDVFSSGAMTLNTTAQTNVHWSLKGELTARALGTGTATTLFPKGCRWRSHAVIGSPAPTAGGAGTHMLPYNAAPAVGAGFDNSVSQLIDLYATWSVSNAANSIQLQTGHIDIYT